MIFLISVSFLIILLRSRVLQCTEPHLFWIPLHWFCLKLPCHYNCLHPSLCLINSLILSSSLRLGKVPLYNSCSSWPILFTEFISLRAIPLESCDLIFPFISQQNNSVKKSVITVQKKTSNRFLETQSFSLRFSQESCTSCPDPGRNISCMEVLAL